MDIERRRWTPLSSLKKALEPLEVRWGAFVPLLQPPLAFCLVPHLPGAPNRLFCCGTWREPRTHLHAPFACEGEQGEEMVEVKPLLTLCVLLDEVVDGYLISREGIEGRLLQNVESLHHQIERF